MVTLTLQRPQAGNQINLDLAAELKTACRTVQEDDRIWLLVLMGSGDTFSVGREPLATAIAAGPVEPHLAWLRQAQVASTIAGLAIPVIVAINGDALDH